MKIRKLSEDFTPTTLLATTNKKAPAVTDVNLILSGAIVEEEIFSENEEIDVNDSVGRIVADTSVGCPPAVPVLVSGEKVTAEAVKVMQYYGIYNIKVIK
jgi:arginine/lysine/ornithine decarboxylase